MEKQRENRVDTLKLQHDTFRKALKKHWLERSSPNSAGAENGATNNETSARRTSWQLLGESPCSSHFLSFSRCRTVR